MLRFKYILPIEQFATQRAAFAFEFALAFLVTERFPQALARWRRCSGPGGNRYLPAGVEIQCPALGVVRDAITLFVEQSQT